MAIDVKPRRTPPQGCNPKKDAAAIAIAIAFAAVIAAVGLGESEKKAGADALEITVEGPSYECTTAAGGRYRIICGSPGIWAGDQFIDARSVVCREDGEVVVLLTKTVAKEAAMEGFRIRGNKMLALPGADEETIGKCWRTIGL